MVTRLRIAIFAFIAALLLCPLAGCESPDEQILLATTTSVRDSGLLPTLLVHFMERTGIRVQIVAVGSGAALRMGAEGNADVLLTHAPEGEEELVASGAVLSRRPFMENHFVIAGPPEDPADVRGAASAAEAYRRIAASGAAYVSRGDDSGTHRREKALLREAGVDAVGDWPGFLSSGSGMGVTLQIADQRRAYTLSDLGTFVAFAERVDLEALSKPTRELRNVYSVLRVNPERFPDRVKVQGPRLFEAFLLDSDTQQRIGAFGRERYGRPLFRPLHLEE